MLAGAVKLTTAEEFPAVAEGDKGALGAVGFGVTALVVTDDGPVPTPFVAVTVNVYDVPSVSPVTVIGLAVPMPVWPPELVTV